MPIFYILVQPVITQPSESTTLRQYPSFSDKGVGTAKS